MRESGWAQSDRGTAYRNGLTGLAMRDNGLIIKQKEKENLHIQMGIHMKAIGRMIRQMGLACLLTPKVERSMKVFGRMICNMVQEYNLTAMAIDMRGCSSREREMERAPITMQEEKFIRETG